MVADVCSIYVRETDGALLLIATEGLKPEAVKKWAACPFSTSTPTLQPNPMPTSRRDFLKFIAASALAAPLPCLSGQEPPRALWLQREKEWGLLDIESEAATA
jgi:hypothetical protein